VGSRPIQIAVAPDAVWVTLTGEDAIVALDPATGAPAGPRVELRGGPRGIAFGSGRLWVSEPRNDTLAVVDPAAARVVERIDLPEDPREVRFGAGAVWVTSARGQGHGRRSEDARQTRSIDVGGVPYGLAVGEG
jgi:streptogramin lyase